MSADLFAEFGYGASTNQPSRTSSQQDGNASQTTSLIPDLNSLYDAAPSQLSSSLNDPTPLSTQRRAASNHSVHLNFNDSGNSEQPQPNDGNNVLFDATLESFSDGSDDWGEFESPEVPPSQPQAKTPTEKQRIISTSTFKSSPSFISPTGTTGVANPLDSWDAFSIEDKPSTDNRHPINTLVDGTPTIGTVNRQPTKPKSPVHDEPFEEWGDFIDGPTGNSRPNGTITQEASNERDAPTQTANVTPNPGGGTPQANKQATQSPPAGHVRPTNIPPPSILLELFPQLFEQLRQQITEARKSAVQEDILDVVALSILNTLTTAARVVAGRTLRWKRDSILGQSMRIGPARSGKSGGMKLSTVNKNEDIKERQEAVDVINMWRDRAALFNSVIQAVGRRPVRVILENTRVTTATAGQGAIKASHACALCGLKRDERIPKIDENVEDSFGEWWTEHWGHTECRRFWESNMGLLGQR
ncbi:uncharacterized protein BJX67DRAFT_350100 [Aspergillus lucknowensis]|uniref:Serine/threonine-protein kinase ppk6 n=1 Tax=Aspergillus lucknowensis TaxID=176173 RepID=A0ABR4LZ74_9EURO